MSTHVFILNDQFGPRTIFRNELDGISRLDSIPDIHDCFFCCAPNWDIAMEVIDNSPRFDVWSVDYHLIGEETGLDFLRDAARCFPEKWPKEVLVSTNHSGRAAEMWTFIKEFEQSRKTNP